MRALFRDDGGVGGTFVVEQHGEGLADCLDILGCDTEGGGGQTDLLDEVADLVLVESHEPGTECQLLNEEIATRRFAYLWTSYWLASPPYFGKPVVPTLEQPRRTPKYSYKWVRRVLEDCQHLFRVAVCKERSLLLVRVGAVCRLVHHQRHRATIVEEVLRNTDVAAIVGGLQATVEVRQKVDGGAVEGAGSEDTWDHDANVRLGVVADDGGVDDQGQEGVLVGGIILLEESSGVIVADGGVRRALRDGGTDGSENSKSFELHDEGW